jgi:hypothetical protein
MDLCCGHSVDVALTFKDEYGGVIAHHTDSNCDNLMDYLGLLLEGACPVCENN